MEKQKWITMNDLSERIPDGHSGDWYGTRRRFNLASMNLIWKGRDRIGTGNARLIALVPEGAD